MDGALGWEKVGREGKGCGAGAAAAGVEGDERGLARDHGSREGGPA